MSILRNLDWNLLKVFTEIVRHEGVSKAAIAISRQQPAVSSALKKLETQLGFVLCKRGPGGFELTDQGIVLWEACKNIESELALLPEKIRETGKELAIDLRIIMINNLVSTKLDSAIAKFGSIYPRVELKLDIAPYTVIEQLVLSKKAEVGISHVSSLRDDLQYNWLYREHHILVCGTGHRLYGETSSNPDDFVDESFVLSKEDEELQLRRFRENHGWGKNVSGQSSDMNEVKRMVLAGMGVALLPQEFLGPELQQGSLWKLMTPSKETQTDIFVVTNPENPLYFYVQQFLDVLSLLQTHLR